MVRWAAPELVAGALTGDEAAAERLVAAVWPGCYRLAATVIGDAGLAQDAAQEACVLVHRRVRTLRSAEAFDAWLYRVVMREASRVRRRHRGGRDARAYDAPIYRPDETASVDVWRALAELSPELRDVVVLFYLDDLTSAAIAAALRTPHATVRTRLARARERLRGLLDDYRDVPSPTSTEATQHAL